MVKSNSPNKINNNVFQMKEIRRTVSPARQAQAKGGIEGFIKSKKQFRRKEIERRKKVYITEAPLSGDE